MEKYHGAIFCCAFRWKSMGPNRPSQSDGHSKQFGLVENIARIAKELQKRHLDTTQELRGCLKINCQTTLWSWRKVMILDDDDRWLKLTLEAEAEAVFESQEVCQTLMASVRNITLSVFFDDALLNFTLFHPGDFMFFVGFDSFILTAFADYNTSKLPTTHWALYTSCG